MIYLSIRTDKPEAEIAIYNGQNKTQEIKWQAHRELAATLHKKIKELLDRNKMKLTNLGGIVCYRGPGSFTGLRIGITVANTMASELSIGVSSGSGENWQIDAIKKLESHKSEKIVLPEYGQKPHITKQKR